MEGYTKILRKLDGFTRKYYKKQMVKGLLLFLVFGLLFWLLFTALEYFLWMGKSGRLLLFILSVGVGGFLLYWYVGRPASLLFRMRKGISNKDASLMIGKHFSEVGDKLYNLLDLADDPQRSDLLMASIEQRSARLDKVPFINAIDFRENLKYARYLLIPLAILGVLLVSGRIVDFLGSYGRVVNYDLAFERPAPFQFELLTENLEVFDNESFDIKVRTIGSVKPNAVFFGAEWRTPTATGREWGVQLPGHPTDH